MAITDCPTTNVVEICCLEGTVCGAHKPEVLVDMYFLQAICLAVRIQG